MSDDSVKVTPDTGGYSAATIDTDLRNSINCALLHDGHVTKIQNHLLQSLQSNPTNWPTLIQTHALTLLRSGEVTSFPTLLKRVLDDVRAANSPAALAAATIANNDDDDDAPGDVESTVATVNGNINGANGTNGISGTNRTASEEISLVLPKGVVVDALKVTRECIEQVVSIEES